VSTSGTPTTYTATPVPFTEDELARIQFNDDGLVPAIVQDATDRVVLMFAWMSRESLRKTLETGRTWFWSRSRQEFWCKGETSGDRQYVRDLRYDCDGDVLLVVVDQEGDGACHTGNRTCFYRTFGDTPPTS
jgi:phosphoribosyl-AMP cyclohydrolase